MRVAAESKARCLVGLFFSPVNARLAVRGLLHTQHGFSRTLHNIIYFLLHAPSGCHSRVLASELSTREGTSFLESRTMLLLVCRMPPSTPPPPPYPSLLLTSHQSVSWHPILYSLFFVLVAWLFFTYLYMCPVVAPQNPGFDFSGAEFNGEVPDARSFMGGVKYT